MEEDKLEQHELIGESSFQGEGKNKISNESESEPEMTDFESTFNDLQQQYDELNDRYLRLAADFDNYKKRTARDTNNRITYAIEQFAVELLDVVDNLDRALAADDTVLREGMEQIQKILLAVLERHNIMALESLNTQFDPQIQEAIAYVPSEQEEGTVIDEIVRGYRMHDKVIRCAKVAVSKGKDKEE